MKKVLRQRSGMRKRPEVDAGRLKKQRRRPPDCGEFATPMAQRKAVQRARGSLPNSAEKFAAVVEDLVQKSTPTKRQALKKRGLLSSPRSKKRLQFYKTLCTAFRSSVKTLKNCYMDSDKKKKLFLVSSVGKNVWKKYRLKRTAERELGLRWKYLLTLDRRSEDYLRKVRVDAVPQEVKKKVAEFYKRPDVSREIPSKKAISKKTLQKKYILENSIETTHKR